MINVQYFLVTYDRLYEKIFAELSEEEKQKICCYAVSPNKPKEIAEGIDVINEWELPWYDSRYQVKQYYEYGMLAHFVKNPQFIQNLTHIGFLHYDIIFHKDSINEVENKLEEDPNQIFYIMYRDSSFLYLSKDQVYYISDYLSKRLNMNINPENIWNNGWISEALSVTPKYVFQKFGEFLLKFQDDIEHIIKYNRWDINRLGKHRPCGFVERLWGFYLVSLDMPINKLNITHDWDSYHHEHGDQLKYLKL
jgi:hypothetical protein